MICVYVKYYFEKNKNITKGEKMVIIFDDNEPRLESLRKSFRMANVPMIGRKYEYYTYCTKPILTVLINPRSVDIRKYLKEQGTAFVIVAKKKNKSFEKVKYVIINEDGIITPKQAIDIISEEYGFNFKLDCVNCITIVNDEEERNVYFAGKDLSLTPRQFSILSFFAYQRYKIFDVDEILEYLFLEKHVSPQTLEGYIGTINGKCQDVDRERIIIKHPLGYAISEVKGFALSLRRYAKIKR